MGEANLFAPTRRHRPSAAPDGIGGELAGRREADTDRERTTPLDMRRIAEANDGERVLRNGRVPPVAILDPRGSRGHGLEVALARFAKHQRPVVPLSCCRVHAGAPRRDFLLMFTTANEE